MKYDIKDIRLADWEQFGEGYTAKSYYHKTDDSVMLKLYEPFIEDSLVEREKEVAETIKAMGIATPDVGDIVRADDGRIGIIFERVYGKKSFSRLTADAAEAGDDAKITEYGAIYAAEAKKLHSIECNQEVFGSKHEWALDMIRKADYLDEETGNKLETFIANETDCTTCLHGDMHLGNLISSDEGLFWIDLADFSYGNPYYDIGAMFFMCLCNSEERSMNILHCNKETLAKFWSGFAQEYIKGTDTDLETFNNTAKVYATLLIIYFADRGGYSDWMAGAIHGLLR